MEFQNQVTYAFFSGRFVALMIDGIIFSIIYAILKLFFGKEMGSFIHIVLTWLYNALLLSSNWQATVGKRLMNIKITDMQGQRISFSRAILRYFASWLSLIILFIGYLMMLFNSQKQTLHDKIAGTLAIVG